ncbi:hypothetical protein HDU88_003208 [Geranomyces variabilis]|nr:hypothetical protein HDU88_003208 [Geranomyces variabilis]
MTRKATDEAVAPDAKRQKQAVDTDAAPSHVFRDDLLSPASVASYAAQFASSTPYLHCVMNDLVSDALLRKVRTEITSALHFTVKETDIYKVHQTGDLANLDGLPADELAQLSSLFELRNALYSQRFRDFLAAVTGCGPLSGKKADMSINTYTAGCHLLNHDDVIGSRRVSYILYLPDPDEPWPASNGGALELYPVVEKGTPAVEPTVSIPPKWNQFVMFTVQPGHSFHSVEEVVVEKARLSVSGWFHVPQEGEEGHDAERDKGKAAASLDQLQEGVASPFVPYSADDAEPAALSAADVEYLREFINPTYLNPRQLALVADRFLDESSIQLTDFLNKDLAGKIEDAVIASDKDCGLDADKLPPHGVGKRDGWTVAGPPHKLRYAMLDPSRLSSDAAKSTSPDVATAQLFADLSRRLFPSAAFRAWLLAATHLPASGSRGIARRFRPGLDYTLAWSDSIRVLDATLCLAPRPTREAEAAWVSDEVGGYECYMAPHEGEEDAAVYKQMDEDGALLTVSAGWNVLTLVVRDEGLMRFVKYVSAAAPASRWDVAFEYEIPPVEEDSDEE